MPNSTESLEEKIKMLAYCMWYEAEEYADQIGKRFPGGYVCLYDMRQQRGFICEIEPFPREKKAAQSYHLKAVRKKTRALIEHPEALLSSDVNGAPDGALRYYDYIISVTGYKRIFDLLMAVSGAFQLSVVGKPLSDYAEKTARIRRLTEMALSRGVPSPLIMNRSTNRLIGKEHAEEGVLIPF